MTFQHVKELIVPAVAGVNRAASPGGNGREGVLEKKKGSEGKAGERCQAPGDPLPGKHRAGHSRKEVFQPHLPVRLPCYDLAPVTGFTLGRSLRSRTSGTPSSHGLTGGVYKARERIHRAVADARLLANPTSRGRVAGPYPNWDRFWRFARGRPLAAPCTGHCNTCVAPGVRAVLI